MFLSRPGGCRHRFWAGSNESAQSDKKYCFYHLTKYTWKKIQEVGSVVLYRSNEYVRRFIGMLDGAAFLDLNHVEIGIRHLRNNLPPGLDQEEEEMLWKLL